MFSFDSNTQISAGSQAKIVGGNYNTLPVAVKLFRATSDGAKAFKRETYILNAMKKKSNIVAMITTEESELAIALKKLDCDLFTYVFEKGLLSDINHIRNIMKQVCKGISHLHKAGIAHLDIKPENVLVDISKSKFYVCDFGLSFVGVRMERGIVPRIGRVGSFEYMAPEVVASPKAYNPFSADIYSIGSLFFVLLTGMFLPDKICDEFWFGLDVSPLALSLLRSLLNPRPELRPKIEEVLKHPFLKEASFLKKFVCRAGNTHSH